jgi:hypothetical protein
MVYWLREVLEVLHVPDEYIKLAQTIFTFVALVIPIPILVAFFKWSRPRQQAIPPYRERVLILGASSGVGKEIALKYAGRGCRYIALVGRREQELNEVAKECLERKKQGEEWEMSQEAPGWDDKPEDKATQQASDADAKRGIIALQGDCTDAKDLIRIREACRKGENEMVYPFTGLHAHTHCPLCASFRRD